MARLDSFEQQHAYRLERGDDHVSQASEAASKQFAAEVYQPRTSSNVLSSKHAVPSLASGDVFASEPAKAERFIDIPKISGYDSSAKLAISASTEHAIGSSNVEKKKNAEPRYPVGAAPTASREQESQPVVAQIRRSSSLSRNQLEGSEPQAMAPAAAAVAHAAAERPSNMFGLPQSEAHTQAVRGLEVSQPLAPHHLPAETVAQSHVVRAEQGLQSQARPAEVAQAHIQCTQRSEGVLPQSVAFSVAGSKCEQSPVANVRVAQVASCESKTSGFHASELKSREAASATAPSATLAFSCSSRREATQSSEHTYSVPKNLAAKDVAAERLLVPATNAQSPDRVVSGTNLRHIDQQEIKQSSHSRRPAEQGDSAFSTTRRPAEQCDSSLANTKRSASTEQDGARRTSKLDAQITAILEDLKGNKGGSYSFGESKIGAKRDSEGKNVDKSEQKTAGGKPNGKNNAADANNTSTRPIKDARIADQGGSELVQNGGKAIKETGRTGEKTAQSAIADKTSQALVSDKSSSYRTDKSVASSPADRTVPVGEKSQAQRGNKASDESNRADKGAQFIWTGRTQQVVRDDKAPSSVVGDKVSQALRGDKIAQSIRTTRDDVKATAESAMVNLIAVSQFIRNFAVALPLFILFDAARESEALAAVRAGRPRPQGEKMNSSAPLGVQLVSQSDSIASVPQSLRNPNNALAIVAARIEAQENAFRSHIVRSLDSQPGVQRALFGGLQDERSDESAADIASEIKVLEDDLTESEPEADEETVVHVRRSFWAEGEADEETADDAQVQEIRVPQLVSSSPSIQSNTNACVQLRPVYVTKAGQRLDQIARELFNNAIVAELIFSLNKLQLTFITASLPAGIELVLPTNAEVTAFLNKKSPMRQAV
jgi:hypothetical protein